MSNACQIQQPWAALTYCLGKFSGDGTFGHRESIRARIRSGVGDCIR